MTIIHELAGMFAERKKVEADVAELFITVMFDVIQKALVHDRVVKIKGLGTFKVIEVGARESINVNTGARVLIESHDKITFTPDAVIKELVNKPFSQFETVVLNDGVEFDDVPAGKGETMTGQERVDPENGSETDEAVAIDTEEEIEQGDIAEDSAEDNTYLTDEIAIVPEPDREGGVQPQYAPTEDTVRAEVSKTGACDAHNEEAMTEEANAGEDMPIASSASQEEEAESHSEPKSQVEQKMQCESESIQPSGEPVEGDTSACSAEETPEVSVASDSIVDEQENSRGKTATTVKNILLCGLMVVLLGASAYCGFLYGRYTAGDALLTAEKEPVPVKSLTHSKPQIVAVDKGTDKATSVIVADTPRVSVHADVPKSKQKEEQIVAKVTNKEESSKDYHSSKYEKMDNRVRTGAYRIIGKDRVVSVKAGESLKQISDRMLGSGMECYVEVYNGLEVGATLKEGQKLEIPKLELKKKRSR